jgi:glycosyltransferase involved in cell wall biosynthesis
MVTVSGAMAARTAHVGYVLTHYPRLAQTFIAGEIAELERRGVHVLPTALNTCPPEERATEDAKAEHERTFYVKQTGRLTILKTLARVASHKPIGFARLLVRATRSGGSDPKAIVWRLFYVVEGLLIWDHCRTRAVRHLHAHFGQAPASVAWFTAEVGNLMDGSGWTFSFTIHGFQDFVNERDARLDLKAASAAYVVCVSDFTRSQLMRVSDPAHWDKFHVVRCGIDVQAFKFRPPPALGHPPRILVVARVSSEKGHVVLLRSVQVLHLEGLAVGIEIVGSGDFVAEVRAEGHRLGIDHLVDFLGELPVHEVQQRLAAADVFCLPSFAEGLPVSIMEAMAVGVPVVTTFISGIPELAVHGHTALVVPAGNVDALADALRTILTNTELRARLTEAARQAVETHHSNTDNVADLLKILNAADGPHCD